MSVHKKQTKHLTVAITGMNARPDNPGPGMAVARCLREADDFDGRIIGLGYDVLDPGLYSQHTCDGAYLLPYPSAGEAALLERIQEVQAKEKIDILIPCLDAEMLSMTRLKPELEELGIRSLVPNVDQLKQRNKDRLGELCEEIDIRYPETHNVTHAGFFYQCEKEDWPYPLMIKGIFYGAEVAYNAEQGVEFFRRISSEWGLPVIVQRFIKGEEVNLTALGDGNGGLHGTVMMRKRALTDKGKAWAGITIWDEGLNIIATKLVNILKWPGPLEVELLRDSEGKNYLIEINPRFPAWIYLSHGVGRNLPMALLRLINGEPLPDFPEFQTGTFFIRHAQEQIVSLQEFESMTISGMR